MRPKLFKVIVARGSELGKLGRPTRAGKVGAALAAIAVASLPG